MCLLTSTWSHKSCLLQILAISSIGSNAPFTVVPAVALTKNGVFPSALCLKIRSSSLSGRILPLKNFKNVHEANFYHIIKIVLMYYKIHFVRNMQTNLSSQATLQQLSNPRPIVAHPPRME